MNIIKTLKSSISEKGNYCYSLPVETTKEIIKDVEQLQQENQELKKQYCERTDCSGRLGNSKKVDQLEKELEQLKEIEKEQQRTRDINIIKDKIKKLKNQLEE